MKKRATFESKLDKAKYEKEMRDQIQSYHKYEDERLKKLGLLSKDEYLKEYKLPGTQSSGWYSDSKDDAKYKLRKLAARWIRPSNPFSEYPSSPAFKFPVNTTASFINSTINTLTPMLGVRDYESYSSVNKALYREEQKTNATCATKKCKNIIVDIGKNDNDNWQKCQHYCLPEIVEEALQLYEEDPTLGFVIHFFIGEMPCRILIQEATLNGPGPEIEFQVFILNKYRSKVRNSLTILKNIPSEDEYEYSDDEKEEETKHKNIARRDEYSDEEDYENKNDENEDEDEDEETDKQVEKQMAKHQKYMDDWLKKDLGSVLIPIINNDEMTRFFFEFLHNSSFSGDYIRPLQPPQGSPLPGYFDFTLPRTTRYDPNIFAIFEWVQSVSVANNTGFNFFKSPEELRGFIKKV